MSRFRRFLMGLLEPLVCAIIKDCATEPMLPLELRRVVVNPGDIVVIKAAGHLSQEGVRIVSQAWESRFPGIPYVLVDGGFDISTLRAELARYAGTPVVAPTQIH